MNKYIVKEGDFIAKNQKIALSGNTGYSTGPHVHVGVKDKSDNYIDPEILFENIIEKGLLTKNWQK